MRQFLLEGHIYPKVSFDPYELNNEFIRKYFIKDTLPIYDNI